MTGTLGRAALFCKAGHMELPDTSLHDMDHILMAITVMCNGWLLIGTDRVKSVQPTKPGEQPDIVPQWGLTDNYAWPGFCRHMTQVARISGEPEHTLNKYIMAREIQTRKNALDLWRLK